MGLAGLQLPLVILFVHHSPREGRVSMSRAGHSLLPLAKTSQASSDQRALWRWGGEKASVSVMEPRQQLIRKTREKHPLAHDFQLVSELLPSCTLSNGQFHTI